MKQGEIIEDNKLIADFMEYKIKMFKGKEYFQPTLEPYVYLTDGRDDIEELQKFTESWDWLMPVVEKIELMGYDFLCIPDDEIKGWYSDFSDVRMKVRGSKNTGTTKIESMYKTVVEFIKWYNKQKQ